MATVFRSKIGLEIVIPITVVFGAVLYLALNEPSGWVVVMILLPVAAFIAHMFVTTHYTIQGDTLTIKCGFLYLKSVDIPRISRISETSSLRSSPATSLDRIAIEYGNREQVILSPKYKTEFIDAIRSLNPNVEVRYKNG